MEIKEVKVFQEFKSRLDGSVKGLYQVVMEDRTEVVSRNGNQIKVMVHGIEDTYLTLATIKFRDVLIGYLDSR